MKVFVTGGTGFVGSHIVGLLLERGHHVVLLVRPGSEGKCQEHKNLRMVLGDALDLDSLIVGMDGCDAVIHLVGIIREQKSRGITFERLHVEATRNAVAAARHVNIRRFVHMSALGTRAHAESMYHRTKHRGELTVKAAHRDWTIFRPSLIFGPEDKSINLFARIMRKSPVFPMFGRPDAKVRPVFVKDVADAFVSALAKEGTIGKVYDLCGPERHTYRSLFKTIARLVGHKVILVRVPYAIGWLAATCLGWLPFFPITRDQFIMINEDNTCDDAGVKKAAKELGLRLRSLEKEFPAYSKK